MPIPIKATETDYVLVPKGIRIAMIAGITVKDGKTPDGQPSQYLRWIFRLQDGNEIHVNSGMAFGPSAKARKWAEGALGRNIRTDEVFDLESLIGTWVQIGVTHTEKSGQTFNDVEGVYKLEGMPQVAPQFYQEARGQAPGGQALQNAPGYASGVTQTYNRSTGAWEMNPAPGPGEPPHPADPEAAIFGGSSAPAPAKAPTLGQRMKAALERLDYQPAQAQQEYRKAYTGDAFSTHEIPEFSKLGDQDKYRVVLHFESLVAELDKNPEAASEQAPDDIPF